MTETWAEILRACAEDDQAAYDNHAKLRRLASLLEQITPEMVETVKDACVVEHHDDFGIDTVPGSDNVLAATASLLSALSTAPTEETEDR